MPRFFSLKSSLPTLPSATHSGLNLVAIIFPMALVYWEIGRGMSSLDASALAIVSTFAAFLLIEVGVRRALIHPDSGMDVSKSDWSFSRTSRKFLLLMLVWGAVAALYWLLPEYHKKTYVPFFTLCRQYGWGFLVLAFPYLAWVDAHQKDPHDVYWMLGSRLLRQSVDMPSGALRQFCLGWLVKAFFLPLMVTFLNSHLESITKMSVQSGRQWAEHWLFGVDVMIGTVGYLMTLRPLGTHIRSTEPSILGWVVAIGCYPPFNGVITGDYFGYTRFYDPLGWAWDYEWLNYVLDVTALFLMVVYVLATVAFGPRFSNLTHRGIITGGPYRYCRHPAYLSKNAFWWLEVIIHMPLDNPAHCVRLVALMTGVSFIYWMRAKTEERHLMTDPEYRRYSAWIDCHGLFSRRRARTA